MFEHVGLVGVGAMGQALLHRLRLADVGVRAFDISPTCLEKARQMGAEPVGSAAAAAKDADAIHLFVRTDDEVLEAVTEADGILSAAKPGAVIILHSTVLPETTVRVAELARQRGVRTVDVPVTAIPARVHEGLAVFLAGGSKEDVEFVRPHLLRLGKALYHFGPLGAGNVAKIAKNLATAIERVASAEVVWVAEAGGVDPKVFLDMMRVEHTQPLMQRWEFAFDIENGHAIPRPASNLLNKDVGLAADYAEAKGLNVKITRAAAETAAQWVTRWNKGGKVTQP